MNLQKISKTISYALRHNPTQFNVALDEMGFCKIDDLPVPPAGNKSVPGSVSSSESHETSPPAPAQNDILSL